MLGGACCGADAGRVGGGGAPLLGHQFFFFQLQPLLNPESFKGMKGMVWPSVCPRLNWQLHFGEPPRWSPGVRFILVDVEPSSRDAGLAAVVLRGDAGTVLEQLGEQLAATGGLDNGAWGVAYVCVWCGVCRREGGKKNTCVCVCVCGLGLPACPSLLPPPPKPLCRLYPGADLEGDHPPAPPPPFSGRYAAWTQALTSKVSSAGSSLAKRLSAPPPPALDYYATLGAVSKCLSAVVDAGLPPPVVVSEGANTMDMARLILPVRGSVCGGGCGAG